MSDPIAGRPRQVTLAGWLMMVGSGLVVALVFQKVAGLNTLETRESVERFLAEPPGSDLGVGVDGMLAMIRTLALVTAGCATAAGILGYQVLQRSRAARLAATVVAVPLFFAGMVTGGFVSSVVAASAVILWMQPARSWFAGQPAPVRRTAEVAAAPTAPPPTGSPLRPADPTTPAPPTSPAGMWPPPHPATCDRRPGAVLWACVLTWVFTGLTVLALVASTVKLTVDGDEVLDQLHRDNPELSRGLSDSLVLTSTYLLIAAVAVWCLAAAAIAVLTFRRVSWARIVLVVSAAGCSALCLLGAALGQNLMMFPLGGALVTIGLLLRPDTAPWFESHPRV